tara:strand:+ start:46 stop:1029 length:984 start_codon:yes stop_codon:yes gene_type:complete
MTSPTRKQQKERIQSFAEQNRDILNVDLKEALLIIEKSVSGGETSTENLPNWLDQRFIPNRVEINKNEYAEMCVNALKAVSNIAATDYGTSRQRDFGQLWADMIRGYLGEIAFVKFLKNKWGIEADLCHEKGSLNDYLPLDIHEVRIPPENLRKPKINISIKTTKWNGIWLDIPGDQFSHSDVHVFVKVGVGRDHLFSFFKEIDVFDKILKIGEEVGSLDTDDSNKLLNTIPSFSPINAYICGFANKSGDYEELSYSGKIGRKDFTIEGWNGPRSPGDLEKLKVKEDIQGTVKFLGIGKFSHEKGYLFNAGSLKWNMNDWDSVIKKL